MCSNPFSVCGLELACFSCDTQKSKEERKASLATGWVDFGTQAPENVIYKVNKIYKVGRAPNLLIRVRGKGYLTRLG